MEGDIKQLDATEIKKKIIDLEDTYAEALKDKMDLHGLNRIWKRIRELQSELQARSGSDN